MVAAGADDDRAVVAVAIGWLPLALTTTGRLSQPRSGSTTLVGTRAVVDHIGHWRPDRADPPGMP
jgi:hypothetical protein